MGLFHGPNKLQTERILKFKIPEQLVLLLGPLQSSYLVSFSRKEVD